MFDPAAVLHNVEQNGFHVLNGLIAGDTLNRLVAEAQWCLDTDRDWLERRVSTAGAMSIVSPARVPKQERGQLHTITNLFSRAEFVELARRYLGRGTFVDRFIVDRELPQSQPVTEWHADQQANGRRSLKFMLYLNDVTSKNGAFSYVPGSHALVMNVMEQAGVQGVSNTEVHDYEQIQRWARSLNLTDCIRQLDEISEHIQGDYESDDYYALAASKGSLIVFDTKGLHRGGVVSTGERFLIRVHCFEPPALTRTQLWRSRVKRLATLQTAAQWF